MTPSDARSAPRTVAALLLGLAAAACEAPRTAETSTDVVGSVDDPPGASPMGEMLLGPAIVGGPAAASWADGRVDLFARGVDDSLQHMVFEGAGWSSPIRFASPVATNDDPAAVSWGPERIDLAVRGLDGMVYHLWCQGRAMCESPDYGVHPLGELAPGVAVASGPAMTSWGPDHLEIFVLGSDARLWQMTWQGGWSGWRPIADGALTSRPAAVSMGPGSIDVFARGTDMALYQNRFEAGRWTGWVSRGGGLADGPGASRNRSTIEVFVRGAGDGLYRGVLAPAWSGWELQYTGVTSPPASVTPWPNHTAVFARSAGGELMHLEKSPTLPLPASPLEPPFDSGDHAAAGVGGVEKASCSQFLIRDLGLLDHDYGADRMNPAERWANDPDCFGDNCNGKSLADMEDADTWGCWALRNPDHFTSNPAWSPAPYPSPYDPFQVKSTRRQGFRDNRDAVARLKEYAIARMNGATTRQERRDAARAALRACHYATDELSCGHDVGNQVCDPAASTLTAACKTFVEVNAKRLPRCGVVGGAINQRICGQEAVYATLQAGAGGGGNVYGFEIPVCRNVLSTLGYDWITPGDTARQDAFRYAAAERIIRHRANGRDLVEPDGTVHAGNRCYGCPDGECRPGSPAHPGENPRTGRDTRDLIDACRRIIEETLCRPGIPRDKVSVRQCECPNGPGVSAAAAACVPTGGECRDAAPGEAGESSCAEAAADPLPIACCGDGQCAADAGEDCSSCPADCGCALPYACEAGVCTCTDLDVPPAECGVTECGRVLPDCPAGATCTDNQCVPDPGGEACAYFCWSETCVADDANPSGCSPAGPDKCDPPCGGGGECQGACCGDPCCGDPCCGDPCCGDPCCGDPCCGDPCCGDPHCGGQGGELCGECHESE